MSDKDFDKIFGDKLREERSFSSQDSDWEQLSKRLDTAIVTKETDKQRRGLAWMWLLLLPILSLLLWQMNDLKNQNKQLAAQLTAVQSQLATHALSENTSVQSALKRDTIVIYKSAPTTKEYKKRSYASNFPEKKTLTIPPSVSQGSATIKTPVLDKEQSLVSQESVAKADTSSPKQGIDAEKMAVLNQKLAELDKQITDLKQLLSDDKENIALLKDCGSKQDSLKKQLATAVALADSLKKPPLSTANLSDKKVDKSLKNNRLFIGLQGGQISYHTSWKNTYGLDIYRNIKSYQASVKAEYALTDKLRLVAEGDFCPFSFQIYWQDKRYNLPALQFDPQKEKYQKAESKQTLVQGNIGAKYFFTEGVSKIRPFVSAAYTLMRIQPFETKFTYQPLWGTQVREQTVQSDAVNVPNLLMFSGGMEYRFSKHWVAQAEAFYYKDLNKTAKTFDLFGLRAAVLLNIK